MFPDDGDRRLAQNICYKVDEDDPSPEDNRECYFDFAVLKDQELAQSTANGIKKVAEEQLTLGKSIVRWGSANKTALILVKKTVITQNRS